MSYTSKTYSLSDEVHAKLAELATEHGSVNRGLLATLNMTCPVKKVSKKAREVEVRASGDLTARLAGRDDIDYSDLDSTPTTHIASLDAVGPLSGAGTGKASIENWRAARKPLDKPGGQK